MSPQTRHASPHDGLAAGHASPHGLAAGHAGAQDREGAYGPAPEGASARWWPRLVIAAVLAAVFAAWLDPHFMVSVANWAWSCF